uniref:Uncharacterized protein n=1 Tax=Mesocestoides corti TaxID=53468 RepID=A0A5K3EIG4_MESCO
MVKRSLNRQCSQNLAAPLPENASATDSFYCTKDSPLLNTLFGQYVEESVYTKKTHDCSNFHRACQKCFHQKTLQSSAITSEKAFTSVDCNENNDNCGHIGCYNTPGCLG